MGLLRFLIVIVLIAVSGYSQARWKPEYAAYSQAVQKWFENLRSPKGTWCCYETDGEAYYGNYTMRPDGSVFLDDLKTLIAKDDVVPANPTGHAIWWWNAGEDGSKITRCFSPGTLS